MSKHLQVKIFDLIQDMCGFSFLMGKILTIPPEVQGKNTLSTQNLHCFMKNLRFIKLKLEIFTKSDIIVSTDTFYLEEEAF